MMKPGGRVLIALSGGADSVCLLYVLRALSRRLDIALGAAHVNHMLRGEEADRDEGFVRELCRELDIPLFVAHVDVAAQARAQKCGVEEAGRAARYAFFDQTAERESYTHIATAHTADDNAETIVMMALRGAGVEGLSGIRPVNGRVVRPLLEVSRAEVEDYLGDAPYQTDSTNRHTDYTRNRIRLELLPYLQQFNPNLRQSLNQRAVYFREIGQLMSQLIDEACAALLRLDETGYGLDVAAWEKYPPAVRRGVIRELLLRAGGRGELCHTQAVLRLIEAGQTGSQTAVGNGIIARLSYGRLTVSAVAEMPEPFCVQLKLGGEAALPDGRRVMAHWTQKVSAAVIDGARLKTGYLTVRSRRAGDWFYPAGMHGHKKKLKDFMIDEKIPQQERDSIPLFCDGEDIVWVGGYRRDERYLPGKDCTTWLELSVIPPAGEDADES